MRRVPKLGQHHDFLAIFALAAFWFGATVASAQTAPPLGQAGSFAVLGASAVTNTGPTVVTGDLGIWPSTASSITGFHPCSVNGATPPGDAVAQPARTDVTAPATTAPGQAGDSSTDLQGHDPDGRPRPPTG